MDPTAFISHRIWRSLIIGCLMLLGFGLVVPAATLTPATQGLQLWTRSDDLRTLANGSRIDRWPDASVQKHDLTAAGEARPTVNLAGIAGRPMVRFAGDPTAKPVVNQYFSLPISGEWDGLTLFMVGKRMYAPGWFDTAPSLEGCLRMMSWAQLTGTKLAMDKPFPLIAATPDAPAVVTVTLNTDDQGIMRMETYANGQFQEKSRDDNPKNGVIFKSAHIGNCNNGEAVFNGEIAEVLLYKGRLADADRLATEHYLMVKYGLAAAKPGETVEGGLPAQNPVSTPPPTTPPAITPPPTTPGTTPPVALPNPNAPTTFFLEAENGALEGAATVVDDPMASGSKVVSHLGKFGSALTFTRVEGGMGGMRKLIITYANGAKTLASTILTINGVDVPNTISLPTTGGWDAYQMMACQIMLKPGAVNTIAFGATGSEWTCDKILISQPPPKALGLEAEKAMLNGPATIENDPMASGGKVVANLAEVGSGIIFTSVNGGSGGKKYLQITYANGAATPAATLLTVNGVESVVKLPSTGGWSIFSDVSVPVMMTADTMNSIILGTRRIAWVCDKIAIADQPGVTSPSNPASGNGGTTRPATTTPGGTATSPANPTPAANISLDLSDGLQPGTLPNGQFGWTRDPATDGTEGSFGQAQFNTTDGLHAGSPCLLLLAYGKGARLVATRDLGTCAGLTQWRITCALRMVYHDQKDKHGQVRILVNDAAGNTIVALDRLTWDWPDSDYVNINGQDLITAKWPDTRLIDQLFNAWNTMSIEAVNGKITLTYGKYTLTVPPRPGSTLGSPKSLVFKIGEINALGEALYIDNLNFKGR